MLNNLKQQSIELKNSIKYHEREIDNPALVIAIVSELSFFIENLGVDKN